jgi:hypothetical protein
MTRRSLWFFCILFAAGVQAQDLRLESLGDLRYGLDDRRASLSLYRFGNNPAWLIRDETAGWLAFMPQASALWGKFKRPYDPARVAMYGTGFEGVKTLGDRGTFHGYSSYLVEERSGVYRSLKRTPYGGEAYFLTDTTTGSFTYKGPAVSFAYAYEVIPGLYLGGDFGYAVQDGLKDVYTMAKSLYRSVRGTVGLAYAVDDALACGITVHPFDEQERLEAKSDDLLDVELFNFRGETFAKRRATSSISHMVRLTGEEYGVQAEWMPAAGMHVGAYGHAGISRTRDLITTSYEEAFEDGFAQRTWYEASARMRMVLTPQVTVGCGVTHHDQSEWSRYTAMDLLLWDSRGSETSLGAGGSYALSEGGALAALEGEYVFVHADSSKFIDNRYAIVRTHEYYIRGGLEVPIAGLGTIRGSYSYGGLKTDVHTGGKDVREQSATFGLSVPFSRGLVLECMGRYTHRSNVVAAVREDLSAVILIRLADL